MKRDRRGERAQQRVVGAAGVERGTDEEKRAGEAGPSSGVLHRSQGRHVSQPIKRRTCRSSETTASWTHGFWRKRRHAGEADDRFAARGAKFHRLQNA